jgi:ATP-dependent DNA helicase RecG
MDEIELRKLILKGEDTSLEFKAKEKIEDIHDLAAEVVAFLNKRGGILLLGVEDDGQIRGFASAEIEACNRQLRSMAKDQIEPAIILDTSNVLTDSGIVIVLTIEAGIDKPYQTRKGSAFYIRSGDEKRHVSHRDELRRLFQVGSHVYAEKQAVPNTRLDQLDLARYRKFYGETHGDFAPWDENEVIDQMRALNLVTGEQLTLAGCLLFAKQPQTILPQFSVKAAWIKGVELSGTEFEDDRNFDGSLPELFNQAYGFLDAWNQRRQPKESSYNSTGEALVPKEVFEEVLTNALVHRDYFLPDCVKIFIFDDRIEIYSPGSLPNSLTVEEAVLGGITRKRNPIIEQIALTLMDYKGHGSGLPRVKRLYPRIQFNNDENRNAFIVTIPI